MNNLIGGLFDDDSKDAELAFKFAVQAINNQRNKQTDGFLEAGRETVLREFSVNTCCIHKTAS